MSRYRRHTWLIPCIDHSRRLQNEDVVITLGDYVNRGPDSRAVLDWLIAAQNFCHLVPLRGNHEIMMLKARDNPKAFDNWMRYGGNATLRSYSQFSDAGKIIDVPDRHWKFLERKCKRYYETDTHFFVHANISPDLQLADQPDSFLYWKSFEDPQPHESGKTMICGHTSQKTGIPKTVGHAVCIDTWACGDGWLTCLEPTTGKYWQANQQGETRTALLETPVIE